MKIRYGVGEEDQTDMVWMKIRYGVDEDQIWCG